MNLIALPRVSSKKQQKGDSVEAQIMRIREFCKSNGHNLLDIYDEDVGRSASIKDDKYSIRLKEDKLIVEYDLKSRPALNKVLQNASSNDFDGICFYKWDRLFRSPPFAKVVQIFLERNNKKLIPTNDSEDPFASDILQIVSKYEVDKTKERIRQVRLNRFEKGIMTAKAPFGYRFNKKKKIMEIDKRKADIVKDIFKSVINKESYKSICERHKLKPQSYYNIIRNKVYCGYVSFEGEVKKGNHQPIISEEDWNRANEH